MTKIYIYCLFENDDVFRGVYSSLKAVHRDALKVCNQGGRMVQMFYGESFEKPSLTKLRNILKGECDVSVLYAGGEVRAKIIKTKLKE
tara:strand:+ start:1149 stop:1412 length:264 start_codon:yes stop_codon:yes gene_type:complete